MTLEKTAKFFRDAKAIWGGLALMTAVVVWGGDQRYALKDELQKDSKALVSVIEINQLSRRNDELEIQKAYATDSKQIQMMDAIININKNKIQTIIDEKRVTE